MYILQTERLQLRQMAESDSALMLAILTDPDFIRYVGDRKVQTHDQAEAYIRDRVISSYAEHGFGMYLVEAHDAGRPMGICGLVKRPGLDDVDIGFAFLPAWRSHGYAYEAAVAVLDYAADKLALKRLVAVVSPDNQASIRLLERLGFQHTKMLCLPGEDDAVHLLAISLV